MNASHVKNMNSSIVTHPHTDSQWMNSITSLHNAFICATSLDLAAALCRRIIFHWSVQPAPLVASRLLVTTCASHYRTIKHWGRLLFLACFASASSSCPRSLFTDPFNLRARPSSCLIPSAVPPFTLSTNCAPPTRLTSAALMWAGRQWILRKNVYTRNEGIAMRLVDKQRFPTFWFSDRRRSSCALICFTVK